MLSSTAFSLPATVFREGSSGFHRQAMFFSSFCLGKLFLIPASCNNPRPVIRYVYRAFVFSHAPTRLYLGWEDRGSPAGKGPGDVRREVIRQKVTSVAKLSRCALRKIAPRVTEFLLISGRRRTKKRKLSLPETPTGFARGQTLARASRICTIS